MNLKVTFIWLVIWTVMFGISFLPRDVRYRLLLDAVCIAIGCVVWYRLAHTP